ncbi:hypothetical protein BZZ01_17765 [Nostocales cyanobacterium HT-58-2]|nr:hypothetical protein BZZ01_17765 [Nostocales cyanobacterium HT-58-2]
MSNNSIQGNGNWYYTNGQWESDEGADLSVADAFASGNPPAGYIPDNISSATGNPLAGSSSSSSSGTDFGGSIPFAGSGNSSSDNPFAGGNPFMIGGGGNVSTTSADGQYTYNYTRTADARSLVPDDNSPFAKLLGVLGVGSDSSSNSGSNPFAGGSNPFSGGSTPTGDTNPQLGGNNPYFAGNGSGNSALGSSDKFPGNLPIANTAPSSTSDSILPEAPEGLSVPYNSNNWISDLKDLQSGEPGASTSGNTGSGNGNWFYASNNTANGNGNWYFSDGNTTDGNGNWFYASNNTANGNGNWYFGSGNTTDGNGNWSSGGNNTINGNGNRPSGSGNTINGNGNKPSGSGNNILGNANTSNTSGNNILGNHVETSGDGKAYIGNDDWSFDILNELKSLQSGVSGVGSDVNNFLSNPDLISTTTSKEGFSNSPFLTNSNYQFDFSSGL